MQLVFSTPKRRFDLQCFLLQNADSAWNPVKELSLWAKSDAPQDNPDL